MEHIDRFNQLLQELEYNRPSTISPLQSESVNLQFMTSLGDGWETFIMAKGDWIRRASTAELHAEVRAMDTHKAKPKTTTSTPATNQQSSSDIARALSTHFDSATGRWNDGYSRGRGDGGGF